MLSEEDKSKLITALKSKIGLWVCPICDNNEFTIIDGYIVQPIQGSMTNLVLGDKASVLPSAALVCDNCGFTSYYNLGALGLLKTEEKSKI